MSISRPIRNNQTPSPLTNLSSAAKVNTDKHVHGPVVKETAISPPSLNLEEAKREAARGFAKLNLANRDPRDTKKQAMNKSPGVEMRETRTAIQNMAGDAQFRQKFTNLVQSNEHIDVPVGRLSPNEQKIVLEELSRKEVTQHLKKVKLDLHRHPNLPLQDILKTMEALNRHGDQKLEADLDLSATGIDNQSAIAIAKALPASPIAVLNLDQNEIGDEGIEAIAAALSDSKLTSLNVALNMIGNKGIEAIAVALSDSELANLNVALNMIGNKGIEAIAVALSDSELANLNLSGNGIGDEGVKALAAALSASKLASLDLSCNEIGNEGIMALAAVLSKSGLAHLDLTLNQIEDEGIKALAAVLSKSRLAHLILCDNAISDESVSAISTMLRGSDPTSPKVLF